MASIPLGRGNGGRLVKGAGPTGEVKVILSLAHGKPVALAADNALPAAPETLVVRAVLGRPRLEADDAEVRVAQFGQAERAELAEPLLEAQSHARKPLSLVCEQHRRRKRHGATTAVNQST